jgi:hypothetical protein
VSLARSRGSGAWPGQDARSVVAADPGGCANRLKGTTRWLPAIATRTGTCGQHRAVSMPLP